MAELKPCPFCGGKACVDVHSFYDYQTKGFTDHTYGVVCENCNAQTSQHYLTKSQAKGGVEHTHTKRKRWGEVNIEALQAENKELRFALDREIDERNKIGVMYEELQKKYAEMEKEIAYMKGQISAFQFCASH